MSQVIDLDDDTIEVYVVNGNSVVLEIETACSHGTNLTREFPLTAERAVQLSRALVKAAAMALGVK